MRTATRPGRLAMAAVGTVLLSMLGIVGPAKAADFWCPTLVDGTPYGAPLDWGSGLGWQGCDLTGLDLSSLYRGGWGFPHSNFSGANLTGASMQGIPLAGSDLSGANLTGATFGWTDLTDANLTGANLTRTGLIDANLTRAQLQGATLMGTYVSGTTLAWADLHQTNLSNVDLSVAKLSAVNLSGQDLTRQTLTGMDLSNADLHGATLTGMNLSHTYLIGTDLTGAHLDGADLSDSAVQSVRLVSASARNAQFIRANGWWGDYTGADLTGTVFTGGFRTESVYRNAILDNATFTDAIELRSDLTGASMRNATIRGSRFDALPGAAGADLTGATIDVSRFVDATLSAATFTGAHITATSFDGATVAGSTFDGATSSSNTWNRATCADNTPSEQRVGGDCLGPRDTTAPTSAPTTTGPGTGTGHWYTGPVTVTWHWADDGALSPASCPTATSGITTTGTVSASCADLAGNRTTASTDVRLDLAAPTVTATLSRAPDGTNGWYRTAPTLRYTCTDVSSGIADCPTLVTATQGTHTVTATAHDIAGNATTITTTLKVDSGRPAVALSLATLNGYGAQVPTCTATDATSGIAACRVSTTASTRGDYRYATATATDKAGNTAVSVKVLYRATTVAVFTSAPSRVAHGARFSIVVTSKNAKGALISLAGVRALLPVKTTATGAGPASTRRGAIAIRTGPGTYRIAFTAPRVHGYYRYAIRVGTATITKVIRIT